MTTLCAAEPHHASRDDEVASLTQRLAAADADETEHLRHEIVEACLPVADGIAHRFRGRGVEDDDLEQVARTALVAAVTRFDPSLGHPFVPYAVLSVEGELKRFFRDHTWAVRPPRRLQELRLEARVTEESLRHELAREPTVDELAEVLGADPGDVRTACRSSCGYHAVSLDAPSPTGTTLAERVVVLDDPAEQVITHQALVSAMGELTSRERQLLHLRFVEELPQREIGDVLGVSQMQVSRLLSAALKRLRAQLLAAAA
ncbi:sigma-70 family RNA polymerase sigma factor [Knoellia sp. CPCC 206435]|uniref:sigma-70 family RNA polymerase sigma factor n=1 Tax=Knoellia terrae TaxID=3404797 RepID=UPI003B432FD2